jgi:hypothetical protein
VQYLTPPYTSPGNSVLRKQEELQKLFHIILSDYYSTSFTHTNILILISKYHISIRLRYNKIMHVIKFVISIFNSIIENSHILSQSSEQLLESS